jgi:uncharacterized protein (UPF0335 family)
MTKKTDDSDLIDDEPPLAGVGHNSVAGKDLIKIIETVEDLIEQRGAINEAIRETMDVAKVKGYDKRTIREVIKLRALNAEVREERQNLLDTYLVAVGLA